MNYGARSLAADRFRRRWPFTLPVPTDSRLQVIKWAAQMVLDHLFTGAHDLTILPISPLVKPSQTRIEI
jgi:hypothetical protein